MPDSQLKKTQILVARPVGRSHQGTGAATSTQITHVSGEVSLSCIALNSHLLLNDFCHSVYFVAERIQEFFLKLLIEVK